MRIGSLLLVLGVLLIAGITSAYECSCTCDVIVGSQPAQTITIVTHGVDKPECCKTCAAICGGYANCSKNCSAGPHPCCNETYCKNRQGFTGDMLKACNKACGSTCELKKTINDIRDMIYYVAGVIAAIMFVIHGYKLMTSTNPKDRDDAKRGIMFVILALIVIVIAGSLVNLLIGATIPPSGTTVNACP